MAAVTSSSACSPRCTSSTTAAGARSSTPRSSTAPRTCWPARSPSSAGARGPTNAGVNQFDGGAPFYAVYETKDARYVAVGALEPQFYRQLLDLLELDVDPERQHDRTAWPELRRLLEKRFAERTRAEWAAVFEGTDACVAPVLSLTEAAGHPHLAARATLVTRDGVIQPATAPRFSVTPSTPGAAASAVGADTDAVFRDWGLAPPPTERNHP